MLWAFTGRCRAAGLPAHIDATRVVDRRPCADGFGRSDMDGAAIGGHVAQFAAEAATRRLPLKRQCSARLRVSAEPRVYPRTSTRRASLIDGRARTDSDGRIWMVQQSGGPSPSSRLKPRLGAYR